VGRCRWAYGAFTLDTEDLISQVGGGNTSEDIGDVAGNIGAVGEGQVRITGAAECNLALGELPAEGPTSCLVSNPNLLDAECVWLTG